MINPFFKNCGPIRINKLLQLSDIISNEKFSDIIVKDIKDLVTAKKENITFFHSKKYTKTL